MSRELIRNIIHACRDGLLSPDAATDSVIAVVKKMKQGGPDQTRTHGECASRAKEG